MNQLYKTLAFLAFVATAFTQLVAQQNDKNIDAALKEIFGPNPSPSPQMSKSAPDTKLKQDENDKAPEQCVINGEPGECIPYYLCDDQESDYSSSSEIDSISPEVCVSSLDTCCSPENRYKESEVLKD